MPILSKAVAVSVVLPESAAPESGLVSETLGGDISGVDVEGDVGMGLGTGAGAGGVGVGTGAGAGAGGVGAGAAGGTGAVDVDVGTGSGAETAQSGTKIDAALETTWALE